MKNIIENISKKIQLKKEKQNVELDLDLKENETKIKSAEFINIDKKLMK